MTYKLPSSADMHQFGDAYSPFKICFQALLIGFVLSVPYLVVQMVSETWRFANWIFSGFPIATFPHTGLINWFEGDFKIAALLALAALFYRFWMRGKFGKPICATSFTVDLPKDKAMHVVENYLNNIASDFQSKATKNGRRFIGLIYEERWHSLYLEVYVLAEPEEGLTIVSTAVSRPASLFKMIDTFHCDFGESRGHCLDVRQLLRNHLNSGKAKFRKPISPLARAAVREAFVPLP